MLVLPRNKDQKLVLIQEDGQPLAVITAVQVRHRTTEQWEMRLGIDCSRNILIQRSENMPAGYMEPFMDAWVREEITPQSMVNRSRVLATLIWDENIARQKVRMDELRLRDPVMHALVRQQLEARRG